MTDFKWETPPPITRSGRQANPEDLAVARALRNDPGRWMRVVDFEGDDQTKAGAVAHHIRAGKRAAFRTEPGDGEFEATSRRDPDRPGVTAVYVRYVDQVTD